MNFVAQIIVTIIRIAVGGLFIFSGLIKANDTLGFSYKLVEYFEPGVLNIPFFIPYAVPLAMLICIFEVIVGFTMLIGARVRLTLWLSLLMIIFFTFLTFYSAQFDVVKTCGCFGDAITLTPWESFTKDVVLLVLILILFAGKQYIMPLFGKSVLYPSKSSKMETIVVMLALIFATAFPLYTYSFLPIKDFRPYAIGKNIPEQTKGIPDEIAFSYILKNKKTGKLEEVFTWPENWTDNYIFEESKTTITKKGIDPVIKDFQITSLSGDDYTDMIEYEGNNFVLVCYSLETTNLASINQIEQLRMQCEKEGVKFVALTASSPDVVRAFNKEHGTNFKFFISDGIVLKTMIRSNPGLLLLNNGVVKGKWHFNTIPLFDDLDTLLLN